MIDKWLVDRAALEDRVVDLEEGRLDRETSSLHKRIADLRREFERRGLLPRENERK